MRNMLHMAPDGKYHTIMYCCLDSFFFLSGAFHHNFGMHNQEFLDLFQFFVSLRILLLCSIYEKSACPSTKSVFPKRNSIP